MNSWDEFERISKGIYPESKRLTPEVISYLIERGVDKTAASSAAAKKIVDALMDEGQKVVIEEAEAQVLAMRKIVSDCKSEYLRVQKCIEDIDQFTKDVRAAQDEHGELTDERAKNAVTMYAALMKMNSAAYADARNNCRSTEINPNQIVKAASYCVYAFLGGQARRIYADLDD